MKKIAVPLAMILLGFLGLLAAGLSGGIPEIQVAEVHAAQYRGREIKVHGILAKIESRERPLRFVVRDAADASKTLAVYADKTRPDTFQESYDISVEGRWDEAKAVFVADKILTKCPTKYEAEVQKGITNRAQAAERDARGAKSAEVSGQ